MMAKYDDKAVIRKLTHAFSLGATVEIACDYAGIGERTYYQWQVNAEAGDENYKHVLQALKSASAEGDMAALDRIMTEGKGGAWQAAAWRLERKHPTKYGNNAGMRELNDKLDQLLKERDNGKEVS